MKLKMIDIAEKEGSLQLKGNAEKCGAAIEKYLSTIRKVLILSDPNYSDLNKGFDWCAAYVYYIVTKAGFLLAPTPIKSHNKSLGLVSVWREWALEKDILISPEQEPQPGDIVLFDQLISEHSLDHMGVVIENTDTYIICSEGNINNQTNIVKRTKDIKINSYIRLVCCKSSYILSK